MRVIRYCSGVSSCCQCSSVLLIFFGVSVMAMILARAPFLARRTWVLYWEPPRSSRERKSHDDKRGLERTVLRGLRGGRRLRTPLPTNDQDMRSRAGRAVCRIGAAPLESRSLRPSALCPLGKLAGHRGRLPTLLRVVCGFR